jgi:hypothetical protein
VSLRPHLTRAGLSLAVTGLAAAALTGTGTTSAGHDHLAVELASFQATHSAQVVLQPNLGKTAPVTGRVNVTLTTKKTVIADQIAPGWRTFTFSGKPQRSGYIFRLKGSYTAAKLKKDLKASNGDGPAAEKAFLRLLKNSQLMGGADSKANAVTTTSMTLRLVPGNYVLDNVPQEDGKEFVTPFTVPAGPDVGTKPTSKGALSPFEYGFSLSKATAGLKTFKITNVGQQVHIGVLVRMDGHTKEELEAALQSDGPPPSWITLEVDLFGPISKSTTIYKKIKLASGARYGLLCFMPEQVKKDAPPHFLQGMIRVFDVA